jgi:thiol-disulfide isomerase/thioredoxin
MERLTLTDFLGQRLLRSGPTAVLFAADWCGFCREFLPRFHAREGTLSVDFALADVTDLDSPWWETFDVEVVPSIIGFREGNIAWRINGIRSVGLGERDLDQMADLVRNAGDAAPR